MGIKRSPKGGLVGNANLTGNADFITIHTVMAHESGDFGDVADAKTNAARLAQGIMTLSNMNYISVTSRVVDLTIADERNFHALGTDYNKAATTVYTIKFLVEQNGYVDAVKLNKVLQTRKTPFTTLGVPITGINVTRDESVYELDSATAANTSIKILADL